MYQNTMGVNWRELNELVYDSWPCLAWGFLASELPLKSALGLTIHLPILDSINFFNHIVFVSFKYTLTHDNHTPK